METFGEVLCQLEPETRSIVRRIEQNQKKITNTHYAVVFDKKCLQEGLLPNFTSQLCIFYHPRQHFNCLIVVV